MPSPILARADALMQRRRQNSSSPDEVPVLTDALDEDDVPILLDVETGTPVVPAASSEANTQNEEVRVPEAPPTPPSAPLLDLPPPTTVLAAARHELIVHELARRIEQRLASELPRLIESTVRAYLAEQEMGENTPPRA